MTKKLLKNLSELGGTCYVEFSHRECNKYWNEGSVYIADQVAVDLTFIFVREDPYFSIYDNNHCDCEQSQRISEDLIAFSSLVPAALAMSNQLSKWDVPGIEWWDPYRLQQWALQMQEVALYAGELGAWIEDNVSDYGMIVLGV